MTFHVNPASAAQLVAGGMADYMARIAPMMDAAAEDAHNTKVTEAATKELTRLIKVYGDDVADILEAMVIRHNAMNGEESPV